MRIPNYDSAIENSNFKRLLLYMPSNTFRMLMCGPSGCGKTNTLMHMLYKLIFLKSRATKISETSPDLCTYFPGMWL